MKAFLKLIRIPNLTIVALTQYLLYYHILLPAFSAYDISPRLNDRHFAILVFVTIIITGGGYIINDILDYSSDMLNRPQKVIVKKLIAEQTAYWMYFCLTLIGFVSSLYLALVIGNVALVNLFPLAVGGLYLYSAFLKKKALAGNLLIAAYCSGVAVIVWVAERAAFEELEKLAPDSAQKTGLIFLVYLGFAFLSTLFRELIKDIEDLEGDKANGFKTFPILHGIRPSKRLASFCGFGLIAFLVLLVFRLRNDIPAFSYVFSFLAIILPQSLAIYMLSKAKAKEEFHRLSQFGKFIMLSGIIFLIIISQAI